MKNKGKKDNIKKKKNRKPLADKYWLFGMSVLCVAFMVLSVFSEQTTGPFRTLANVTVIPMQQGINTVGNLLGEFGENFKTLKQVQKENKALQEQINALVLENTSLQEDKYELARLQELYKLHYHL